MGAKYQMTMIEIEMEVLLMSCPFSGRLVSQQFFLVVNNFQINNGKIRRNIEWMWKEDALIMKDIEHG